MQPKSCDLYLGRRKALPSHGGQRHTLAEFCCFFSSCSKAPSQKDQTYEDMTSDGTPPQLLELLSRCTSPCVIHVCECECTLCKEEKQVASPASAYIVCHECKTVNIFEPGNFARVRNRLCGKQVAPTLVGCLSGFPQDLTITSAFNLTSTKNQYRQREKKTCMSL